MDLQEACSRLHDLLHQFQPHAMYSRPSGSGWKLVVPKLLPVAHDRVPDADVITYVEQFVPATVVTAAMRQVHQVLVDEDHTIVHETRARHWLEEMHERTRSKG